MPERGIGYRPGLPAGCRSAGPVQIVETSFDNRAVPGESDSRKPPSHLRPSEAGRALKLRQSREFSSSPAGEVKHIEESLLRRGEPHAGPRDLESAEQRRGDVVQ